VDGHATWPAVDLTYTAAGPQILAVTFAVQLLPTLLPRRWTTHVRCGQAWNIGPERGHDWTVLDDSPVTTDDASGGGAGAPG
jgi:hypothetical protein